MGYLAQKKRLAREALMLKFLLPIFVILAVVLPLFPADFWLKKWLFQIYVLNLLVLFFAIYCRSVFYSLGFALCVVINYFQMAAYGPLFGNEEVPERYVIEMTYAPDSEQMVTDSEEILRTGSLILDKNLVAPFAVVRRDNQQFTLIRINLENVLPQTRRRALQKLRNFITAEDDAAIVYGHFGTPAWSGELRDFLRATGLEVKNRLVFSRLGSRHAYLMPPSFYVLGFRNVGISRLKINPPATPDSYPRIDIRLGTD